MSNNVTIYPVENGFVIAVEAEGEAPQVPAGFPVAIQMPRPTTRKTFVAMTLEQATQIAQQQVSGLTVPAVFKAD